MTSKALLSPYFDIHNTFNAVTGPVTEKEIQSALKFIQTVAFEELEKAMNNGTDRKIIAGKAEYYGRIIEEISKFKINYGSYFG